MMIQLQNISKSFAGRMLFNEVGFQLGSRERLGLVGRNGAGKSTLFNIILGRISPDEGSVSIPKNYRLGNVEQHLSFSCPTVLEEVCTGLSKENEFDHYLAEKILFGLGFSEEQLQDHPDSFSGGYQVRIQLAKALVGNPHLLLLDEPTNYLDILSLRWLSRFLKNYEGEVILITHDRHFMNEVATHIGGLSGGKFLKIKGDTHKYYSQLAEFKDVHQKTKQNQERKKKEMEKFVERFRAKASKARQAQSKLKQIEKMDILEDLVEERELHFSFNEADFPAKTLLQVNDLKFSYDNENFLFEDLSFFLKKGSRLAIIGKNGKGKSTLMRNLVGKLQGEGEIRFHPRIEIGHFDQTNIEILHPCNSVYQEIQEVNPGMSTTLVKNIAGCMMFTGDDSDKRISVLSGGEKSRVMLAKIIAKPTNLLFLDEPTNHLDQESIESLIEAINRFKGGVVMVTHNEYLLNHCVDQLIIFQKGKAFYFEGNYQRFLEKIGWDEESDLVEKEKKRSAPEKKTGAKVIEHSKQIAEIEESIVQIEEVIEKLNSLIEIKSTAGEDFSEVALKVDALNQKIEEKFIELESLNSTES